ncbi:hypothetical protein ACFL6U_16300 [Planctomycetota bacterium]
MINHIFSFLVHPGKGYEDPPEIGGTTVPSAGKLFQMVGDVFDRSDHECNTEIAFVPTEDGQQHNECRGEIIDLLQKPRISNARQLADRLQKATDGRSGLGLLFIVTGEQNRKSKILLARFPADFGVLAEENQKTLQVQFLERVFMKHALSYKAAIFSGTSFDVDFWDGYVVDRQLSGSASYWIKDFLLSDFRTTPEAGTRRLAEAMHSVVNSTSDGNVRSEILAAVRLAPNMDGQPITVEMFCERFNLSGPAREAIVRALRHDTLQHDRFQFCGNEFQRTLPFRSIELNNNGILTAPTNHFEEIFEMEKVSGSENIRFMTEGKVINDGFRKRK